MFGINQTSTQDSNELTIFQTTYRGVDLVTISILSTYFKNFKGKSYFSFINKIFEKGVILRENTGYSILMKTF